MNIADKLSFHRLASKNTVYGSHWVPVIPYKSHSRSPYSQTCRPFHPKRSDPKLPDSTNTVYRSEAPYFFKMKDITRTACFAFTSNPALEMTLGFLGFTTPFPKPVFTNLSRNATASSSLASIEAKGTASNAALSSFVIMHVHFIAIFRQSIGVLILIG